MLVRVLYVSEISLDVSMDDIERLVAHARRRNRQLDLTGALLANEGYFAQVLEGREVLVEELMRKIAADPRHRNLRVQERIAIKQRLFADWDMAFIHDSRSESALHGLLQGNLSAADFMAAVGAWVEEQKSAPL